MGNEEIGQEIKTRKGCGDRKVMRRQEGMRNWESNEEGGKEGKEGKERKGITNEEEEWKNGGGGGQSKEEAGYLKVAVIKLSKQNVMNWVARPL